MYKQWIPIIGLYYIRKAFSVGKPNVLKNDYSFFTSAILHASSIVGLICWLAW